MSPRSAKCETRLTSQFVPSQAETHSRPIVHVNTELQSFVCSQTLWLIRVHIIFTHSVSHIPDQPALPVQQLLMSFGGMSEDVENEMTESPDRGGLCATEEGREVGRGGGMGGPPPAAEPLALQVRVREAIRSWTQPAESRASASWSQHSSMVETRLAMP